MVCFILKPKKPLTAFSQLKASFLYPFLFYASGAASGSSSPRIYISIVSATIFA